MNRVRPGTFGYEVLGLILFLRHQKRRVLIVCSNSSLVGLRLTSTIVRR
ncbi:hypothetical protein [Nocardia sp. NPDC049149]